MLRDKLANPQFRISIIGAVAMALFALFVAVVVLLTLELSHETMVLGPGFYPLLLSVGMFLSSAFVIFKLLFGDDEELLSKSFNWAAQKKPLMLFGVIIIAVAVIPLIGFIASMFLFSMIELSLFENNRAPFIWRVIYSLALVLGIYFLFDSLGIPLPVPYWM